MARISSHHSFSDARGRDSPTRSTSPRVFLSGWLGFPCPGAPTAVHDATEPHGRGSPLSSGASGDHVGRVCRSGVTVPSTTPPPWRPRSSSSHAAKHRGWAQYRSAPGEVPPRSNSASISICVGVSMPPHTTQSLPVPRPPSTRSGLRAGSFPLSIAWRTLSGRRLSRSMHSMKRQPGPSGLVTGAISRRARPDRPVPSNLIARPYQMFGATMR